MLRSEIRNILSSFTPTGLSEMENVELMNRMETKYVFSLAKLTSLLYHLSKSYKVLEIENLNIFPYHTTYLDTSDYIFYMQQIRGKLSRHKIRYRRYESTGVSFLEIKKKTNKNRTIKWRIENRLISNLPDNDAAMFIGEYLPEYLSDLRPVLINGFNRITLVGIDCRERVTLDFDLTFSNAEGKKSEFPFLVIAELKREKQSCVSPFGLVMKQIGIQPNGFSKYCIGSALVNEMPRKNTLKYNLLLINKIENEYIKSAGY
jgi:hypothetical protein